MSVHGSSIGPRFGRHRPDGINPDGINPDGIKPDGIKPERNEGARYFVLVVGYSGTPLPAKLGIKDGTTVALLKAPDGLLAGLPSGVAVKRQAKGTADVVLAFFTRRAEFEGRLGSLGTMIFPAGGLWIAWPKQSSGVKTDMTAEVVREVALPLGLVDNKVCAISETWTGLRVVWRVERRAG